MEPSQVADVVEGAYDRRVVTVEPLPGGETNELWTVATDKDRLVVRVSASDRTKERLRHEHDVLRALRRYLPFVVVPVTTAGGDTFLAVDDQLVSVFPFVEDASPMDPERVEHRRARAAAMGTLHRVTNTHRIGNRRKSPTPTWWGQWPRVRHAVLTRVAEFDLADDERAEIVALLDDEHAHVSAWIEERAECHDMASGLIHGDFNHRNVLMSGDIVAAVVDWDACRMEWYASEVAGLSPDVLDCYLEAGGISSACDPRGLQMLARFNNANEVLWVFNENGLSDEIDLRAGEILREVAERARLLQTDGWTG